MIQSRRSNLGQTARARLGSAWRAPGTRRLRGSYLDAANREAKRLISLKPALFERFHRKLGERCLELSAELLRRRTDLHVAALYSGDQGKPGRT